MKTAIDVRDMHTGIHSLFLVERKPKTTCKLFWSLSNFNDFPFDEMEAESIWESINKNTESIGEINYRDLQGDKFWRNGELLSDVTYNDGEFTYKIIGSYDIY